MNEVNKQLFTWHVCWTGFHIEKPLICMAAMVQVGNTIQNLWFRDWTPRAPPSVYKSLNHLFLIVLP